MHVLGVSYAKSWTWCIIYNNTLPNFNVHVFLYEEMSMVPNQAMAHKDVSFNKVPSAILI